MHIFEDVNLVKLDRVIFMSQADSFSIPNHGCAFLKKSSDSPPSGSIASDWYTSLCYAAYHCLSNPNAAIVCIY